MSWIPLLSRLLIFNFLFTHVHGFNFVVSPPTQCGAQRFTWVGGTPPFYALILPPNGTLRNISIPSSAWNEKDQSGDFATPLPLVQNGLVVFSMGDATGQTTGGVSNVMTVGAAAAGAQACNTTDPGVDFFFSTNEALIQCKDYPFSDFIRSGAVLPISILVTVPLGESFILHPPNNSDPFVWRVNVTAGTSVLFTMTDAQNRVGGTASLITVQASDDSSCVQPLPSSAAPTRTPSPSGTAPATNTGSSGPDSQNHDDSHTGIIIGASVGGAVVLLIAIAFIYFFVKRNKEPFEFSNRIDLTEPGPDASTYLLPPGHGQQTHHNSMSSFPPYQDSVTPSLAGPSNISSMSPMSPMSTYGNLPPGAAHMDPSTMGTAAAAGTSGFGAAGAMLGAHAYQQSMSHTQQEAMLAQQRQYQRQQYQPEQYQLQQQQEYFDPYDNRASLATASNYPTVSNRHTAQSDMLSHFGTGSSSNFNVTSGPSSVSSRQSGSTSKQRQSSTGGALQPQRFIVHTDIEEEPIELPPVYSESRGPIPGISSTGVSQTQKTR